jgi:hypothetical protein
MGQDEGSPSGSRCVTLFQLSHFSEVPRLAPAGPASSCALRARWLLLLVLLLALALGLLLLLPPPPPLLLLLLLLPLV